LLELARDAEDEAAQCPDRERQDEGHIGDDHTAQRVHLVIARQNDVERNDQSACGSIWIPITSTMKSFRPVKRYFASATAARNASAIEIATVTRTMITLFLTSCQKNGCCVALRKCDVVGCSGTHVGLRLTTSMSR